VLCLQTGSVEKCLREEYGNLLEAALSMPLAIMHSVMHDVAGSLTFNAAAAAAQRLKLPPHRWRHHVDVTTRVKAVQMGIRVELWRNAPLSLAGAPAAEAAPGEEPSQTLMPAMEVGTLHGAVACCCDPPVRELWQQAGAEEELGRPAPVPRVDPVGVDLESSLLVRPSHHGLGTCRVRRGRLRQHVVCLQDLASACALMQLVMLRKLLDENFVEEGWTSKDLEAAMRVTLAQSAASLQGASAGAAPQAAVGPAGDGVAGLRAAVGRASVRYAPAELDRGGDDVVSPQPPHTDAQPGPAEEPRSAGLPAHRPFASAAGPADAAHARRPVPLLLVDVRGRLAVAVGLDLISGAVCLHAGEFSEYGRTFTTVRHRRARRWRRRGGMLVHPSPGRAC